MHRSAKFQTPLIAVDLLWSCIWSCYKACEGVFLLCFLGQIVTWQYNPNLLDYNRPCTVINDHDCQLRNGPLGGGVQPHLHVCHRRASVLGQDRIEARSVVTWRSCHMTRWFLLQGDSLYRILWYNKTPEDRSRVRCALVKGLSWNNCDIVMNGYMNLWILIY